MRIVLATVEKGFPLHTFQPPGGVCSKRGAQLLREDGFSLVAMNHEERDDLWELLGQARPAKVSPFFSRNVLRAIREEKAEPSGVLAWLLRRWPFVAAAACVLIFAGIALRPDPSPVVPIEVLAENVAHGPDYAVIGNLDELLAAQESSAWLTYSAN